ncbi:MAG: SRPBCC family protein [Pigmentiphaga sp.]
MEIEKILQVDAPVQRVWEHLLDPRIMGQCVPGMQSIDVISDVEYLAVMAVKVSFISAKFRLRTVIVEQQAPYYLRCEGTGEDASVASSLKQQSELFLKELGPDRTEVRIKVSVDVLGRLGSFGLGMMKTKADRMWDEFGVNLNRILQSGSSAAGGSAETVAEAKAFVMPSLFDDTAGEQRIQAARPVSVGGVGAASASAQPRAQASFTAAAAAVARGGWLARIFGSERIEIDLKRGDLHLKAKWPASQSAECLAWLKTLV